MFFFKRIFAFCIGFFFVSTIALYGQEPGDFRSYSSGFWNDYTTWERFDGTSWNFALPGQVPDAESSVWVQRNHVISLNEDAAVLNIHINAGLSLSDGSGNGRILIGDYTLLLYGYLRTFRAGVGVVPGEDWSGFTGPSPLGLSTSSQGMLRVVGSERALTAPSSYSDRISRFRLIIDVGEGTTIHLNARFRASEIDIVSGTLDAHTFSIRCEAEPADGIQEQLIIRQGARLRSSASGVENSAVLGRGNGTSLETLIIEEGAFFELLGENPFFRARNILNNGTVIYSGHNQAFLLADGSDSPESMNDYKTLILGGAGMKILNGIVVQVSDSLILQEEARLSVANNGGLNYNGADPWLVYRGAEAQTADSLEWNKAISTKNIMLDNPSGLIIRYPLEISGTFQFKMGMVTYSESGLLSLGQEGSFQGMSDDKFVNGPVEVVGNVAQFLPIGKSGMYHPVIAAIEGSGNHRYTLEVIDQQIQGAFADPIVDFLGDVHWQLSTSAGNLNEGTLTVFYDASQFPFSSDDLVLAFANDFGDIFEARPNVTSTEGALTVSVNPEGLYTLATITPFAEQHFHHFEVRPLEEYQAVEVSWSIRQDDLSESLHLYRSRNAYEWELVKSFMLEPFMLDYLPMQHRDRPPATGTWYYQLEHRRLDVESIFTKVVRIEVKPIQKLNDSHVIYYPATDRIGLEFNQRVSGGGYRILNAKGITVDRGEFQISEGINGHIPAHTLPSGLYILVLEWNEVNKLVKRFFKP